MRKFRRGPRARGFHQIELLIVVAVFGLIVAWGLPRLIDWSSAVRVRLAADECVVALRKARLLAISRSTRVGLKFRFEDDRYTYALYEDGDGDGLLTADIDAGTDPELVLPRSLDHMGADVGFGFPDGIVPTDPGDPGRPLDRLDDPIRFNASDIASFSPLGESTPGSLYITGGGHLAVVRVLGLTGKVRILVYDREAEVWHQR